jgi:hypothetical protein
MFAKRQSRASKLVYSDNGSGVGSVDESLVLENGRIFNVLEHGYRHGEARGSLE